MLVLTNEGKRAERQEELVLVSSRVCDSLMGQEKYSELADLRHFQAAAGARDLCAFLEGLPEVTLQRKQRALLVCLVFSNL